MLKDKYIHKFHEKHLNRQRKALKDSFDEKSYSEKAYESNFFSIMDLGQSG